MQQRYLEAFSPDPDRGFNADVIIVGAGIAGLYTALRTPRDMQILILSKDSYKNCNSYRAQGGIACVVDEIHDHVDKHFADTMTCGHEKNDPRAVRILVEEGPCNIEKLIDFGVPFDRHADGRVALGMEGAHSEKRILHVGDYTGKSIMDHLHGRVRMQDNIRLMENVFVIDVLEAEGKCRGVVAEIEGRIITCLAGQVVLATGGIGRLFDGSTNANIATGDGIAMAARAGAELVHMTYVQFHPTVFYPGNGRLQRMEQSEVPESNASKDGSEIPAEPKDAEGFESTAKLENSDGAESTEFSRERYNCREQDERKNADRLDIGINGASFLISEAVRGEGAVLRNRRGEAFMEKAHPYRDLAPRDIVSGKIFEQMRNDRSDHVYLDATSGTQAFLKSRFPFIYGQCERAGYRMERDMLPVAPKMHYFMGGIQVDHEGRTNIDGLYACGECAHTGVHGANRLASNSLLEAVVFGNRIAARLEKKVLPPYAQGEAGSRRVLAPPATWQPAVAQLLDSCYIGRNRAVQSRRLWECYKNISLVPTWVRSRLDYEHINMYQIAGRIAAEMIEEIKHVNQTANG